MISFPVTLSELLSSSSLSDLARFWHLAVFSAFCIALLCLPFIFSAQHIAFAFFKLFNLCLFVNVPLFQLQRSAPDWFLTKLLHYIGNCDKKKVCIVTGALTEIGLGQQWCSTNFPERPHVRGTEAARALLTGALPSTQLSKCVQ